MPASDARLTIGPMSGFFAVGIFFGGLLAVAPLATADANAEVDPWLLEDRTSAARGQTEGSGQRLRRPSSQAVYAAYMRRYEQLPEEAISQRVQMLRRALSSEAGSGNVEAREKLDRLLELRERILGAIAAAETAPSLEEGLPLLKAFANYFSYDEDLRQALLDSGISREIRRSIRDADNSGNFLQVARLRSQVRSADLDPVFESLVSELASAVERKAIFNRWQQAMRRQAPHSGERFLATSLLGEKAEMLPIQLDISGSSYERLDSQLVEDFERRFPIKASLVQARPGAEGAAMRLAVRVRDFGANPRIDERAKASVVLERIEE